MLRWRRDETTSNRTRQPDHPAIPDFAINANSANEQPGADGVAGIILSVPDDCLSPSGLRLFVDQCSDVKRELIP